MVQTSEAGRGTYLGLFFVAMATLMYEILLTRIFSVTMWYHFAFVAVSIALFGMTFGAVIIYMLPRVFPESGTRRQLAISTILFGLTVVGSFLVHLAIPVDPKLTGPGLRTLILTYAVISVPFIFSGISVCLSLTRFTRQVSRLYAADLGGAAIGCLLTGLALNMTDGPSAVFLVAALALVGAACFILEGGRRVWTGAIIAVALCLAVFAVANSAKNRSGQPWVGLTWVKGGHDSPKLYEKWNSFSRVRVEGDTNEMTSPKGWGMSQTFAKDRKYRQLYVNIDATAGTYMTFFDGDMGNVDFLKYDLTNLVHYLRDQASVLVVGAGGGRDVLSALAFNQKRVVGVEINDAIIGAVNGPFGDFTGHLDRLPNVQFHADEARSFIARSRESYDIIQISLIDTWAATAAGAFVLSENSLYTAEAWETFLRKLSDRGILTVSRWYHTPVPGETYRTAALANAALRSIGIADPRKHVVVATCKMRHEESANLPDGLATILVSRQPFTDADMSRLEEVCGRLQFDLAISPRASSDAQLTRLVEATDIAAAAAEVPINVAPPTDDRPFFFNMVRWRDVFSSLSAEQGGRSVNREAIHVLGGLLAMVILLSVIFIVLPVALRADRSALRNHKAVTLFFVCIGLAFILVEISQMQRLIVLLGHPSYSLTVVLFSLLVSSGLGSFTTQRVNASRLGRDLAWRFVGLLAVLVILGLATPWAIHAFQSDSTPVRVAVALALLMPAGFFMGMCFPVGMKIASARAADISPWLWGINGAMSVVASVLAVVIAMWFGIAAAWWTGVAFYAIAVLMLMRSGQAGTESIS